MASDSDPRLKKGRTSVLSRGQLSALGFLVTVIVMSLVAYYSEVVWEIEHVKRAHAYVNEKVSNANQLAYNVGDAIHSTPVMQSANDLAYNFGEGVSATASWMGNGLNQWADELWDTYDDYYGDEYYTFDYIFDDDNAFREKDLKSWNMEGEDIFYNDYSYFENDDIFPDYFVDEEEAAEFFEWGKGWQRGTEQSRFEDLANFGYEDFYDYNDFDYEYSFWQKKKRSSRKSHRKLAGHVIEE